MTDSDAKGNRARQKLVGHVKRKRDWITWCSPRKRLSLGNSGNGEEREWFDSGRVVSAMRPPRAA